MICFSTKIQEILTFLRYSMFDKIVKINRTISSERKFQCSKSRWIQPEKICSPFSHASEFRQFSRKTKDKFSLSRRPLRDVWTKTKWLVTRSFFTESLQLQLSTIIFHFDSLLLTSSSSHCVLFIFKACKKKLSVSITFRLTFSSSTSKLSNESCYLSLQVAVSRVRQHVHK